MKNVPTSEDCRDSCNKHQDCDQFVYDEKKKICLHFLVDYKKKSSFASGAKYCTKTAEKGL